GSGSTEASRPRHSRNWTMATVRPEAERAGVPAADQHPDTPANGTGEAVLSKLQRRLHRHPKATLASNPAERLSQDDLRVELSRVAEQTSAKEGHAVDFTTQQKLVQEALSEVFGYGPIDSLLLDQEITDIFVNGPRQIYFERRGQLQTTDLA